MLQADKYSGTTKSFRLQRCRYFVPNPDAKHSQSSSHDYGETRSQRARFYSHPMSTWHAGALGTLKGDSRKKPRAEISRHLSKYPSVYLIPQQVSSYPILRWIRQYKPPACLVIIRITHRGVTSAEHRASSASRLGTFRRAPFGQSISHHARRGISGRSNAKPNSPVA